MAALWRSSTPLSVRDVHEVMHYSRDVAYTTVLTVLDRLAKKGVVERSLTGRAWMYSPLKTCVDLHVDEILQMMRGCGHGHAEAIIAGVQRGLDEISVEGHSCMTTGDPAWTPPVAICAFSEACAAVDLDCASCPSKSAVS